MNDDTTVLTTADDVQDDLDMTTIDLDTGDITLPVGSDDE